MAVFLAGSDESAGKDQRDPFFFGGFVGPKDDWSRFFVPAWKERVLDGPPAIPYLHMTDIRSPQWRAKYGLSRLQADDRVDEAFNLLDTMPTFYPVGICVNAGHLRDKFASSKVVAATGAPRPFEPDYLCFLGYAFVVLSYVRANHPEAKRVDFVIERKQHVTRYVREFHSQLALCLQALREPSLSSLVGELLPGGKEVVPLQAADVLCWHSARQEGTMDAADRRRYSKLAHRFGCRIEITNAELSRIDDALSQPAIT
jgi:hypothetical protein